MSPVGSLRMVMVMPLQSFNKFVLGAKNVPGIILCPQVWNKQIKVPGCMGLSF